MFRDLLEHAMGQDAPKVLQDDMDMIDEQMDSDSMINDSDSDGALHDSDNDSDVDSVLFGEKVAKQRRKKRKRAKFSMDLKNKLGDANLAYADGDYDTAIRKLKSFIQIAPTFAEPYLTLASVYLAKDEMYKCVQFSHIAAALTPKVYDR